MKKGFMFSLDALFAGLIVLALVTAFLFLAVKTDTGTPFKQLQKLVFDASVVSSYTGESPGVFSGISETASPDALYYACADYESKSFCAETGGSS